jgi:hypothetical protein
MHRKLGLLERATVVSISSAIFGPEGATRENIPEDRVATQSQSTAGIELAQCPLG